MKSNLSKILGVVAMLSMLVSMVAVATPVSAAIPPSASNALVWNSEGGPSSVPPGARTLVAGSAVSDIAVASDGQTVYAVSSGGTLPGTNNAAYASNKGVFKSTNGGVSWAPDKLTSIGSTVSTANVTIPQLVAVAPGDPNTVAVVGDSNKVFLSSDGGITFNQAQGDNMTMINAVAISPLTSGVRYVAVAGTNNITGAADIQYFPVGSLVSQWQSVATSSTPDNWQTDAALNGTNVLAIAFSPNFASDKVLNAVTANASSTSLEILSFSSHKKNAAAGFLNYPKSVFPVGYAGTATSTMANIVLPSTYLGADQTLTTVFVGLTHTGGTTGDVYRLQDTGVASTAMGFGDAIYSVDYNGTVLVAGSSDRNLVFSCANPTAAAAAITYTTTSSYQSPTGANKTVVAWQGTNVVAGTSGLNSAFAVSGDNGVTFNDVSLINNKIVDMVDFAVAADSSVSYLLTDDNCTMNTLNVYRNNGTWQRVLALSNLTNNASKYIVKIAPDNSANFYVIDTAGTDMYYSNDSGEKTWSLRSMNDIPVDAAVESSQVVYFVTSGGKVYKSVNAGFTWDNGTAAGIGACATITSIKTNQLIVGGTGGSLAYSIDGDASPTTWKLGLGIFTGARSRQQPINWMPAGSSMPVPTIPLLPSPLSACRPPAGLPPSFPRTCPVPSTA